MSSAIEVLKRLVKEEGLKMSGNEMIYFNKDEFNALKEALLALKQKERLKEWLEKEIKHEEEIINDFDLHGVCANRHVLAKLKEVLERVGEQK